MIPFLFNQVHNSTYNLRNHLEKGLTPLLQSPFSRRLTLTLTTIGLIMAAATPSAHACDACNLTFADQVLGERQDSLIGRELRKIMENQKDLKLEGLVNPTLSEIQADKLDPQADNSKKKPAEALPDCCDPVTGKHRAEATPASPEKESTSVAPAPAPANPRTLLAEQQNRFAQVVDFSDSTEPSPISVGHEMPDYMQNAEFIEIIERDYALETTPYSTVPQDAPVDKSFDIVLTEGQTYIGNGIVYDGFLTNGQIPGPTLVVDQGDVVEMNIINEGTIPHGASIHAAYTQTSKYVGKINAGDTKSVRFRAMMPGVYLYHCAPGGHAIGMHVLGGQYGMIVVKPPPGSYQLEKELGHEPNLELYMIQHELYATGKDAIEANPEYVLFNGKTFQYVEEPIMAKPGDYVRMYFLNVGPNILSTFHIVGLLWDYVYWQGNPEVRFSGGQTVTAGPSDSFVIEFRMPPDEGAYTMLTHAVGSTNRGAIGLIVVDGEADLEPHREILADGPSYSEPEIKGYLSEATRVISPFGIGTHPKDEPVRFGPETKEVKISMKGNSFYPKVVEVAPGTTITWTNEDVFTYLAGEYAGIHNAQVTAAPEGEDGFTSPLLAHGESWSVTLGETQGQYDYICTPHPYMKGRILVKEPEYTLAAGSGSRAGSVSGWVLPLVALSLIIATASFVFRKG